MKLTDIEQLLTSIEAARLLRVTPVTIVLLAEHGQIDGFKVGRSWRFTVKSIEDYITSSAAKAKRTNRVNHLLGKTQPVDPTATK